jgi:hypothetical protein
MAISVNTGTVAGSSGATASQAITIPAGVLAGDVMFLVVEAFATTSTISVTSTGSPWTQIGPTLNVTGSGNTSLASIWYAVAGAADPGAVVTAHVATGTAFWSLALESYTGASNSAPVDVSGGTAGAFISGGTLSMATPSETTGAAGDWAIYAYAGGTPSVGATTAPGTSRQIENSNSGIIAHLSDSNGSVGGAGTAIGGASNSFTDSSSGNYWPATFTVGLALPSSLSVIGDDDVPWHIRSRR